MKDEELEAAYEDGKRAMAIRLATEAMRSIGIEEPMARLVCLEDQLREAQIAAKSLCEQLEIEYPGDDMNLADVIEKHIGRAVNSA